MIQGTGPPAFVRPSLTTRIVTTSPAYKRITDIMNNSPTSDQLEKGKKTVIIALISGGVMFMVAGVLLMALTDLDPVILVVALMAMLIADGIAAVFIIRNMNYRIAEAKHREQGTD